MTIVVFLVKRIAGGLVLLLILSFLVFGLVSISPGSPVQTLLGTRASSPALVKALMAEYHLNNSIPVQYWHWLYGVMHLNFGQSIAVQTGTSVSSIIVDRLGLSLELAFYAFALVLVFGLPLGLLAGIRRGGPADRVISVSSTIGISAPSFAASIVALYVFGVALRWLPVYGAGTDMTDRMLHLTLPAVTLAALLSAVVVRQTRATTLTVMQQDYITFARVRGLSPARILIRYALRNSSLPVVTSAGLLLIVALTATVFIEQVFSLPGAGSLLLAAVTDKDVPLIQGLAMALGAAVILINILVDLTALLLDPRTRSRTSGAA